MPLRGARITRENLVNKHTLNNITLSGGIIYECPAQGVFKPASLYFPLDGACQHHRNYLKQGQSVFRLKKLYPETLTQYMHIARRLVKRKLDPPADLF